MLTREQIREIIEENPLKILFSREEIEAIIEELFMRYGFNQNNSEQNFYQKQEEFYEDIRFSH